MPRAGRIASAVFLTASLAARPSHAESAAPIQVMAAGSLKAAMTEMGAAFLAETTIPVEGRFGSAGALRDRIDKGESADLFAPADIGSPRALAQAGKAGPVVLFAHNRMCALVRPGLSVTAATLLATLLDPKVTIGTSTPKTDPAGDYAWQIFAKADAIRPGARATLEAKARKFIGRATPPPAPAGVGNLAWILSSDQADPFIAYCSGAKALTDRLPGATSVPLPAELAVQVDLGLTLLAGGDPRAARFALFMLSQKGQEILARNGFEAPLLLP